MLGVAVGADDQVLAGLVEAVERVEELLEDLLLPFEELDVVEQENVDGPVAVLERLHLLAADAVDELVEELLRAHVADQAAGGDLASLVPDGVEEVGLPQTRLAVDEQRVVLAVGLLPHRHGGGVGEAVGLAHHEVVEGVSRHEPGVELVGTGEIVPRPRPGAVGVAATPPFDDGSPVGTDWSGGGLWPLVGSVSSSPISTVTAGPKAMRAVSSTTSSRFWATQRRLKSVGASTWSVSPSRCSRSGASHVCQVRGDTLCSSNSRNRRVATSVSSASPRGSLRFDSICPHRCPHDVDNRFGSVRAGGARPIHRGKMRAPDPAGEAGV